MSIIDRFLNRTRENVDLPILFLLGGVSIGKIADLFRIFYHDIYFWGQMTRMGMQLFAMIFSTVNGILLYRDIRENKQKLDYLLMLINLSPILLICVFILISLFR